MCRVLLIDSDRTPLYETLQGLGHKLDVCSYLNGQALEKPDCVVVRMNAYTHPSLLEVRRRYGHVGVVVVAEDVDRANRDVAGFDVLSVVREEDVAQKIEDAASWTHRTSAPLRGSMRIIETAAQDLRDLSHSLRMRLANS